MKKGYWGKSFRIVLMACMLLMAMMQVVSAEKVEYKDKNYNFKAIKNVLLYDMDFSDTNIEGVRKRSLGGLYEEKAMQENKPFSLTGDYFPKIIVRHDITKRWYNESGVLNIGIVDFLLDDSII